MGEKKKGDRPLLPAFSLAVRRDDRDVEPPLAQRSDSAYSSGHVVEVLEQRMGLIAYITHLAEIILAVAGPSGFFCALASELAALVCEHIGE
jgi:hypothetical protein